LDARGMRSCSDAVGAAKLVVLPRAEPPHAQAPDDHADHGKHDPVPPGKVRRGITRHGPVIHRKLPEFRKPFVNQHPRLLGIKDRASHDNSSLPPQDQRPVWATGNNRFHPQNPINLHWSQVQPGKTPLRGLNRALKFESQQLLGP
jgi:hypothetical protein